MVVRKCLVSGSGIRLELV